jgi:hypothetical protein
MSDGGSRIRMPRLCVVCGDRECGFKNVSFSSRFHKKTIGPFGQDWRRTLHTRVPLCDEHWRHFDWQFVRAVSLIGSLFLLMLAAFLIGSTFITYRIFGPVAMWGLGGGIALAVLGVALMVWLVASGGKKVVCQNITERSLILDNVHHKFADAVEDGRWDDDDARDRERDEDFRPPNYLATRVFIILGFVVLILACGGVVAGFRYMAPRPGPGPDPGPAPVTPEKDKDKTKPPPPATKADPLPIDPAWDDAKMMSTWLSDLPEFDAQIGWGKLGKGGAHGFGFPGVAAEDNKVFHKGKAAPKALAMVPHNNGIARVKYRLEGGYKILKGAGAMADLHPRVPDKQAATPFTFMVFGDGRLLWQSKPMQRPGDGEEFRLSVAGVKELELRVNCPGSAYSAWAAWLDPALLK